MVSDLIAELRARGIAPGIARTLTHCIAAALSQNNPVQAWKHLSQNFLTPEHDFALHAFLYEQCYGDNALLRSPGPAWLPSDEIIQNANITAARRQLNLPDFSSFYNWSINHREAYWELAIRRLNIIMRTRYSQLLDTTLPTQPRWLVGARLNIVESCFHADFASPAILEGSDSTPRKTTTYAQLRALTNRIANALVGRGIAPGDTIGMLAPMSAASVATYLGVIATGAVVVSIADSFAPEEIATRLRIANAKLVITQDVVPWGSKRLPLYQKVAAVSTVPIIVITTGSPEWLGIPLRKTDSTWNDFLSSETQFSPVPRDPQDPINILFSSGTTGEPKAIPWDHTTPIKCAADAHFHHDLHPADVTCWPTNLGWMMGPWLIFATLINKGTMALFDQAPHDRAFGQFVQDAKVTMLGLVPSLVRAWRQSNCMQGLDWTGIKAFSSSGECSNPADMLYLMHLARYRPVIEYCGGTEIGGAYITSTVVQPNMPATFSTPALGIDLLLFNHHKPAPTGEVFLRGPSIGLSTRLLNKGHDAIYFNDTPPNPIDPTVPLRRHGDELESLPNRYYRVAGRSDDTMNLGGIKVGCAEIERALASLPDILETAAIALPPSGGGPAQLVIFTVLRPNSNATTATLKPAMQQALRDQLNPLFRIEQVQILPSLPRTASNKIMRRELRTRAASKGDPSRTPIV